MKHGSAHLLDIISLKTFLSEHNVWLKHNIGLVSNLSKFSTWKCFSNMLILILIVEELKTNLMSLVIFISLIICSTCFRH